MFQQMNIDVIVLQRHTKL